MNTLIRTYLQARYSVTNQDVTTLILRYLAENPSGLVERTRIWKALEVAAAV